MDVLEQSNELKNEISNALANGEMILSEISNREISVGIKEEDYQEFKEKITEWIKSVMKIKDLEMSSDKKVLDPYELDSIISCSSATLKGEVESVMKVLRKSLK